MKILWLTFSLVLSLWLTSINDIQAAQYIPENVIPPTITRSSQIIPTGETNGVCISNTGTPTPAIVLCSTLDLTSKTLLFKLPEYTIANLPATHPLSIVTNGADGSDCVKGGGSTRVLCAWNGAAWASIGGGTGTGTGDVTDVLGTANEICITNSGGPQPQAGLCSTIITDGKTLRVGRLELTGDISPGALTGNTDDWNPTGLSAAVTIRFSTSAVWEIRGLQGGADGRVMTLYNVGSFVAMLKNEATTSTAANRFEFGSDLSLGPKQGILIQYDATLNRWRALSNPGKPPKYCADNGATDAYACNLQEAITTYTTGEHYFFKANTANTGQATLAFNGIASPPVIKKQVGGATTDLDNNDIRIGQIVEVVFDGTNFQMLSQLGNSPTGISGLTTGTVPRAASPTSLQDSTYSETTDNAVITKPIIQGNCGTNCANNDFSAITGQKTITWPNHAGTVPISPNARKVVQVELFDPATDVTSGNGKLYFRVPTSLNGMNLVAIKANTITPGVTNSTSVQITRCAAVTGAAAPCTGTTASMLTTVVSVDSTESDSDGAGTPPAINTSNDDVATNQVLRFDVTAVSTTAPKGLNVLLEFELP